MLKARIENDVLFGGRSLVTTENVSRGEIVVEEVPFAYGSKQNSGIVCLACYRLLPFGDDDDVDRCEVCSWPLCGSCADADTAEQHSGECLVFSNANVIFAGNVGMDGICPQLDCITPLRVLLAKENNPERWNKEVAQMEYHDESRRQMTEIWNADRINIAQYLRGPCKLANRFSEDLIMQVIGVLEVNAFEARTLEGYPFRALYPITGILAHNCVPNTARSIYPTENYKIRLRAMQDLEVGQQLQHSYTFTLNGTLQRQEHIKLGKFFTCQCKRCMDPTELGIEFSTFRCNNCIDGWIRTKNPLDPLADWQCSSCFNVTPYDTIQQAVLVMQTEVADAQSIESGDKRLEENDKLLRKYNGFLHPLHFIQTGIRQNLIEMYGRVKGYEMVELSDELLTHKVELCRKTLQVLDAYEPGLSRARATILYELHVPLVLLAKSAFISSKMTGEELKEKLIEAVEILKECVSILQYEDPVSQEGTLCFVAQQALTHLGTSIEGLGGE